ncbi:MAG: benzoyl-CoA 2,3-epoxidase subunit BoxA [Betaproteobacteria bacterium]|nr:MAG: benzoyl-CoA 2,3-epoxidase subunit BoxA [Betaproteobacteria bacterium]TMH63731.1 MAG: benzoyl-CoA 2,3-epoxidase subunit BoxA [Betaproteobacteria bacterium]
MVVAAPSAEYALQHLIDPETCIRCNTCEATCPIDAITHDSRNYVVDFAICKNCNACVSPCPTGAIDHWHQVPKATPFTLDDQFSWDTLPPPIELEAGAQVDVPNDVRELTEIATAGQGGPASPPWSASHPYVNLYSQAKPAIATVTGNYRLTADGASADIRHIVLDFATTAFPVLEGQTLGILPPGVDQNGKPHHVRLYSVASPRDGERPRYNNVALTIKRVTADHEGKPVLGIGSNYMCDLKIGDQVKVVGPYGTSYLMPNHPGSSVMMVCTGTGSAPMRAITERRRRRRALNEGGELLLFFGARVAEELPYFGPLLKLPKDFIDINFAFSRVADQPKTYVQDRIRERADKVVTMLQDDNCYIYLCGLKGMEKGVIEAFRDVCREHSLDWDALKPQLLAKSRLHIETY